MYIKRSKNPVRVFVSAAVTLFFAVFFSGCTITFDNLTAGTEYHVNDTFTSGYVVMTVERFCWANGQWTDQGKARVMNGNSAGGTGRDVNLNNANLYFALPYPVRSVSVKFGDFGGNMNLIVNGVFTNFHDFSELNGASLGSVNLLSAYFSTNTSRKLGLLQLNGNITQFKIGGQELWIDDVSYQK